jgi:sialate O-acetylesterase
MFFYIFLSHDKSSIKSFTFVCLFAITLIAFPSQVHAVAKLPHVFGNNMVLQCDSLIPVWGWAEPGEHIIVELNGRQKETKTNSQGKWQVILPPQKSGGPFELKIIAKNKIVFSNIYLGDVWICAGQSNMSFPLKRVTHSKEEIASANFPRIRFLTVPAQSSEKPATDFDAQWQICSSKTAPDLSAISYYFSRNVHESLKRPIGIIILAWGGSSGEAWTDRKKLKAYPELAPLASQERIDKSVPCQKAGYLHDGMLLPICPFSIKGVIWYQGESNANRAWQYQTLFPIMIANWRENWGQGDFPFYYVQLPNFMKTQDKPSASAWAELREAQHKTLSVRNVGEVVSIDVGDANDLHPQNKEIIGNRLAVLALAKTYGHDVPYSGPEFRSMVIEDNKAILTFSHMEEGLRIGSNSQCDDSALRGFAIAGKDQKFYWAEAIILDDVVVVSSPEVPNPIAVRYAWADNPICNLTNSAGLPASPFRTDNWAGVTVDAL